MCKLKLAKVLPFSSSAIEHHLDGDVTVWRVSPGGIHRDSETIYRSNHDVMIGRFLAVDPDGADHRECRFGHWAVGWVSELLVRAGSECEQLAVSAAAALEEYAILDEHALSALEMELHEDRECDAHCSLCEDEAEDADDDTNHEEECSHE